jgi:hypothetical protein
MQENLNIITAAEEINAEIAKKTEKVPEESAEEMRTIKKEPESQVDKTTIGKETDHDLNSGKLSFEEIEIQPGVYYRIESNISKTKTFYKKSLLITFDGNELEFFIDGKNVPRLKSFMLVSDKKEHEKIIARAEAKARGVIKNINKINGDREKIILS